MKKILGLLVFISGLAMGQELDSVVIDTVKKVPNYFGGVYLETGANLTPHPPGINLVSFIGGGIQYNRWSIGFRAYDFQGTIERFLIFPNIFELEYRYGGVLTSFDAVQSKWINASVTTSFYKGDMVWREILRREDFLRGKFNLWTLGAKVEMVRLRFLRPYINAGYQQMTGLELSGVENDEFSGFFYGVGLRIGFFNQ
ncbi:MAG: hypothetical protein AB8B73_11285 [Ekhidna sp.]